VLVRFYQPMISLTPEPLSAIFLPEQNIPFPLRLFVVPELVILFLKVLMFS
jgi:hypothetical protein